MITNRFNKSKELGLMILLLLVTLITLKPIQVNAEVKSIEYGGNIMSKEAVSAALEEAKRYQILPSLVISQNYLETQWGAASKYPEDNNWGGVKYPGAGAPGVKISKGSYVFENNHGSNYAKYETIWDYFKDYAFLLRSKDHKIQSPGPPIYNVAGKTDFTKAAEGLFIYGGAKYNYAEAWENYVSLLEGIRAGINKGNGNILNDLDAEAVKNGVWADPSETNLGDNSTKGEVDDGDYVDNVNKFFVVDGYGAKTRRDWDEADIKTPDVDTAMKEIDKKQRQTMEDWIIEYKTSKTDSLLGKIRVTVQVLAIGLMLFTLAILLAYMFDRVGVFDFSALALLTGGRLVTAYDKKDENYMRSSSSGQKTKFIALPGIIIIIVIALTVVVLVFTGRIYPIMYTLYVWVLNLIDLLKTLSPI